MRIIIADNDGFHRNLLRLFLEAMGHVCIETANGRETLAVYHSHGCDLVITEVVMPECDGFESIQNLKCENPDIMIVAITGDGQLPAGNYLKTALKLGAVGVLSKPFSTDELRAVLDLALSRLD
jgi:CheY-like chemotaxis protein